MKTIIFIITLGLAAASAKGTTFNIVTMPYEFVRFSGDDATGSAPISQTDFDLSSGPNYGAGDRSNSPFIFSFLTPLGNVSYLDYFGFGYTLSEDHSFLYANGSIAQSAFGGGFIYASFVTSADGITTWNGGFQAGSQTYTASGTGRWLRSDFESISVPDAASTAALLGVALGSMFLMRRSARRTSR